MRKLAIVMSVAALTVSVYAAPKTTADAVATNAVKAAVAVKADAAKAAGEMKAAACPACKAAGTMCPACKAKAEAKKVADGKDACTSNVCPLKK